MKGIGIMKSVTALVQWSGRIAKRNTRENGQRQNKSQEAIEQFVNDARTQTLLDEEFPPNTIKNIEVYGHSLGGFKTRAIVNELHKKFQATQEGLKIKGVIP